MSNYLLMIHFIVALVLAGAIGLQVECKGHFMSATLIHRDSPMSPFYNSSKSPSEILGEAVTRSLDRINYINSPMHIDAVDIESVIISNFGDYLTKIHSGEEEFLLMILMGAAFTWINCDSSKPKDHHLDSYKMLPYDSIDCLISPNTNPLTDDDQGSEICHYETSYPNNAVSKGVVSQAAFHLDHSDGTKARFDLMFGCSHNFVGVPFKGPVQGIIGLGYGDFPFAAQLASQLAGMKEKISYCLPPYHSKDPVKIIFGEANDVISANERVTLPFRTKTNSPNYYLTLERVGCYGVYTAKQKSRNNMVIDSGITMTILDELMFIDLVVIMSGDFSRAALEVKDPKKKFEFCFDIKDEAKFKGFEIKFQFDGGTLALKEENVIAKHPDMENLKCLMIKSTNRGPMVLGSYAQINHMVELDLNNNQISLVRANCVEEFGT